MKLNLTIDSEDFSVSEKEKIKQLASIFINKLEEGYCSLEKFKNYIENINTITKFSGNFPIVNEIFIFKNNYLASIGFEPANSILKNILNLIPTKNIYEFITKYHSVDLVNTIDKDKDKEQYIHILQQLYLDSETDKIYKTSKKLAEELSKIKITPKIQSHDYIQSLKKYIVFNIFYKFLKHPEKHQLLDERLQFMNLFQMNWDTKRITKSLFNLLEEEHFEVIIKNKRINQYKLIEEMLTLSSNDILTPKDIPYGRSYRIELKGNGNFLNNYLIEILLDKGIDLDKLFFNNDFPNPDNFESFMEEKFEAHKDFFKERETRYFDVLKKYNKLKLEKALLKKQIGKKLKI